MKSNQQTRIRRTCYWFVENIPGNKLLLDHYLQAWYWSRSRCNLRWRCVYHRNNGTYWTLRNSFWRFKCNITIQLGEFVTTKKTILKKNKTLIQLLSLIIQFKRRYCLHNEANPIYHRTVPFIAKKAYNEPYVVCYQSNVGRK
jgi:hypothetical protein